MNDYQRAFESDLNESWRQRNFAAWNDTRIIYADWLEENAHPLWAMARARCVMLPCNVRTKAGPRVWMWRLYFDLPTDVSISPRWASNRRINREPMLGFPPATLRCMGAEDKQCGRLIRFTLTFKPRTARRWVRRGRGVLANAGEWVDAAFDTDVDPHGFVAMFWPLGWSPRGTNVPGAEPTLFDRHGE